MQTQLAKTKMIGSRGATYVMLIIIKKRTLTMRQVPGITVFQKLNPCFVKDDGLEETEDEANEVKGHAREEDGMESLLFIVRSPYVASTEINHRGMNRIKAFRVTKGRQRHL